MTALSDHCDVVRKWLDYGPDEYDDTLVTSWTRMAEQTLSINLRCKHMIQIDTGLVSTSRVPLPSDWLELDFVRIVDGSPLKFRSRTEFYTPPDPPDPNYNAKHYTLSGNLLMVGGNIADGRSVEITYFQEIPPLGDEPNWLMEHYSGLYVFSTLTAAALYGIENDQAAVWEDKASAIVSSLNGEYLKSKASGSNLAMPRRKGFG